MLLPSSLQIALIISAIFLFILHHLLNKCSGGILVLDKSIFVLLIFGIIIHSKMLI